MNVHGKRIAVVLFAAALAGALAGCGSQQPAASASSSGSASSVASTASSASSASSASASSGSEDGTLAPEQAYDEIANLLADSANYSTVTLTQKNTTTSNDAASSEPLESTTVYKFDLSGDGNKSTMSSKIDDADIVYYLDGDNVVLDMGESVYAGTVKEFGLESYIYPSKVIESGAAELADLKDCITRATTGKVGEDTVYTLGIDPEKYAGVNQLFAAAKDAMKINEVSIDYVFGPDSMLKTISYTETGDVASSTRVIEFSDYDATTLEAAPAANKTYEDYAADMKAVVENLKEDSK